MTQINDEILFTIMLFFIFFSTVCRRKIDIAFAVNENMKPNEYEGVKFFLQSVIDRFNVSPDGTHIALITYGIGAKLVFDFNNIQKWNDNLKSKIGNLELQNGAKGKLEDVLIMSCDSIFCTTGGSRGGVPKVCLYNNIKIIQMNKY